MAAPLGLSKLGGCAGASVMSESGPGFKLSLDRMEFHACRVALPPANLFF